ncbi:DUF4276 family protein [Sodalinema gerasimenkoae]|uniref:DUF4276 family protein n=1 Tax=Sodalinema gerasimenkoae TaxID=2862348 RepID=UPI00135B6E6A|nr:DUF4276 family protein [Sodalinema gerasimenkoae]
MSDSLLHLEFLLEEPSLEEALSYILPKTLRNKATFRTHAFRGKTDLIRKLPGRLKGYSAWLPENYKIIVLIDEDREDCQQLKQQLETIAQSAGLTTKSSNPPDKAYQVINRIVIEELEAWFFGDVDAICQAYPKVSPNLANQARYRDPDAIQGGTWEALERVLKRAGYHSGGLEKFRAAREIAPYMNPSINRSRSFQIFYKSLLEMTS